MNNDVLIRRTGASARLGRLFLLLAIGALSVLLLRPVCEAAFGHAAISSSQHAAACCDATVDAATQDLADLAAPAGSGAGLAAAGLSYPAVAPFLARTARLRAGAPPPPLSYYSRSRRILR